jgi:hypothetical protein
VSAAGDRQATTSAPTATSSFNFGGGPLLQNVQVQAIFWGNYWAGQSAQMTQIDQFFTFVVQSSLVDFLGEYGVDGLGTYKGSIIESSPAAGVSVADADIQVALNGWMADPRVQKPAANTLYFVYLPPGVTVTGPPPNPPVSCIDMCGYHWYIPGAGSRPAIYYAVVPFPDCANCQGSLTLTEAITAISSHELCEAITDPHPWTGWINGDSEEIGDVCEQQFEVIGGYTVQKIRSNNQSSCVVGPKSLPGGQIQAIRGAGEASFVFCTIDDGHALLKVREVGGTGQNMFALQGGNGGSLLGLAYPYWLGIQQLPAQVRALEYVSGSSPVTLVGLADGRMLKVTGTGGTGQNMFAVTETSYGFATVSGYNYLVGSQKFSSGIRGIYPIGNELFVALDNNILIKIQGTGGTGQNMLAVIESGGTVTSASGYHYWIGTQVFLSPVNSLLESGGVLIVGLADGRMLKVRGTGGTGQNMFAITETNYGFATVSGYNYLIGSQKFSSAVAGVYFVDGVLLVCLANGIAVKISGLGGTGQNMLAVIESGGTVSGASGYHYWIGTQQFNAAVTDVAFVDGDLIVAMADGRMLKVTGTGGTGQNMFAVTQTSNGFASVSGYNYLVGSEKFSTAVLQAIDLDGALVVTLANGIMFKVNGGGGTGQNMLAVTEGSGTISGVSGYPYWIGTQVL